MNSDQDSKDDEEFVFYPTSLTKEKSHPNHWYNRAADLHAAAGSIWYGMQFDGEQNIAKSLGLGDGFSLSIACRPVYDMLCGLSLEVILKAIIAQRNQNIPEIHDLNDLAARVGIKRSPQEKNLFKYYTSAVVWAGRYPTPKNCSDESLLNFYEDARKVLLKPGRRLGSLQLLTHNDATDWENFHSLWLRISSEFKFGP